MSLNDKGAQREQSAPPKCDRVRLQITLWHFKMVLLMQTVFLPDNHVFCGAVVEIFGPDSRCLQKEHFNTEGYNQDPVRVDIHLKSGDLTGQDVAEVSPACKTGSEYARRGNQLFKQECWMSQHAVATKCNKTGSLRHRANHKMVTVKIKVYLTKEYSHTSENIVGCSELNAKISILICSQ